MKTYKVHEAKTNLSKILKEVQDGETVYLAKGSEVIAEVRPYKKKKKPFPFGLWEGKMTLDEGWDSEETNKEIEELFYNSKIYPDE